MPALPKFTAIAACDPQGVIGNQGMLPWHCPEELQHFRHTTLHHVMLMGYKTYLSMPPRAFEYRTSIVFSTKHAVDPDRAKQVKGLDDLAQLYSENKDLLTKTQFVIGGAEIFELFFTQQLIEDAIISHMHQTCAGDTFCPLSHLTHWPQEILQQKPAYSVIRYSKKG